MYVIVIITFKDENAVQGEASLNERQGFPSRNWGTSTTQMKPVRFLGDSLKCLRDIPEDARQDAGYQLDTVQRGEQPDDFKPMQSIGKGVEEIRVRDDTGAYRIIYIAKERLAQLMRGRRGRFLLQNLQGAYALADQATTTNRSNQLGRKRFFLYPYISD